MYAKKIRKKYQADWDALEETDQFPFEVMADKINHLRGFHDNWFHIHGFPLYTGMGPQPDDERMVKQDLVNIPTGHATTSNGEQWQWGGQLEQGTFGTATLYRKVDFIGRTVEVSAASLTGSRPTALVNHAVTCSALSLRGIIARVLRTNESASS